FLYLGWIGVFHAGLPDCASKAISHCCPSFCTSVTSLPPLIANPDIPTPPLTRQTSFGPPSGHLSSSPVSAEIPFRCGPRNCGQSAARTDAHSNGVNIQKITHSTCKSEKNSFKKIITAHK